MGGAGCPDDAQVFGGQGSYGSNSPLTNGTSEYWNGITWNTELYDGQRNWCCW